MPQKMAKRGRPRGAIDHEISDRSLDLLVAYEVDLAYYRLYVEGGKVPIPLPNNRVGVPRRPSMLRIAREEAQRRLGDTADTALLHAETQRLRNSLQRRRIEWEGPDSIADAGSHPAWPRPTEPPPCVCERPPRPHWHCEGCGAVLGAPTIMHSSWDEHNRCVGAIVACSNACVDAVLARRS